MRLLQKLICLTMLFPLNLGRPTLAQWILPADLVLELVADDELVPDCTNLTCDVHGNVFVAGPGYFGRLVDEDCNGLYERRHSLVEDLTHGAHGLTIVDNRLYYVANDGVWSIPLESESAANSAPTLHPPIKTGGEHDAHAIRRGPDGFWYLIAGNGTSVTLMCEALGGLGPAEQRDGRPVEQQAAVFDGYRTKLTPQFSPELKLQLTEELLVCLKQTTASDDLRRELVRGLAECLTAFRTQIPEIDRRLVEHPHFGSSTHLVWAEAMSKPARQAAARTYLAGTRGANQLSPAVAEFIAGTDLELPRSVIDDWLADEIVKSKYSTQSLMPTGLLDGLTHQQVADLLAYLSSL